jgi:tRNA A37 threonylcarbamoyladenosine dehydratase
MTNDWRLRTGLLVGEENLEKLSQAHVLIAGLGGVGAAAAEAIARAGVGNISIVDADTVEATNRNRQLGALVSTEGMDKTEVWAKRILDINPKANLWVHKTYLQDETTDDLLSVRPIDYVLDCIDTLAPKVHLIHKCVMADVKVVSSMGAGGKLDPSCVKVADLADSYNCTLARYVRKRLRYLGIHKGITVIFSPEDIDHERVKVIEGGKNKRSVIGTISYLPPLFGCTVASVAIRGILGMKINLARRPKNLHKPKGRPKA